MRKTIFLLLLLSLAAKLLLAKVPSDKPPLTPISNGIENASSYIHNDYNVAVECLSTVFQAHLSEERSKAVVFTINKDDYPVADAGNDTSIYMPFNIGFLDGSKSFTNNGGIIYYWEQVSGPSSCTIKKPGAPRTEVDHLVYGKYVFRLIVTNFSQKKDSDEVVIQVLADPVAPGDVPYNANTNKRPYSGQFQYGSNVGDYRGWSDSQKAAAMSENGVHSIRLNLPDFFVGHYGYDIRTNEFNYYTHSLGMKQITLFVGRPRPEYKDPTIFPPATEPSKSFANLYNSIWDNGENGTPVNDNNYFAVYLYNLVNRYGNNIRFWEIVNEPDQTGFWDNGNRSRPDNWWTNPPSSSALNNLKVPIFYYIRMLRI